jgi:hypothetical protein
MFDQQQDSQELQVLSIHEMSSSKNANLMGSLRKGERPKVQQVEKGWLSE